MPGRLSSKRRPARGLWAGGVKVGCCGFSAARATYFRTFPVVEVQQTFYEPPQLSTLEKWRAEAPARFVFTVKSWQLITHEASSPTYRRLRTRLSPEERERCGSFRPTEEVERGWQATLAACRSLAAPVVLFQTPARFDPSERHLRDLRSFFKRIPREGLALVWEPRGPAWKPELVGSLCEELDLVHGVDPFASSPARAPFLYYRLHGIGGYRHRFSAAELGWLARSLAPRASGFLLFNNITMWDDARRMLRQLGGRKGKADRRGAPGHPAQLRAGENDGR